MSKSYKKNRIAGLACDTRIGLLNGLLGWPDDET